MQIYYIFVVVLSLPIRYFEAPDIKRLVDNIIDQLGFSHVDPQFVYCFRSIGSRSRSTVARIHGLRRIWQNALHHPPAYIIEIISEKYDKLAKDEREKTPEKYTKQLFPPHGMGGEHKGFTVVEATSEQILNTVLLNSPEVTIRYVPIFESTKYIELYQKTKK